MSKIKKGEAVWVMPEDYYKVVKACEEKGIKTFSRVNVWYLDVFTATIFVVATAAICILIGIFN